MEEHTPTVSLRWTLGDFCCSISGPAEDAGELVAMFRQFMAGCGYHPKTIAQYLDGQSEGE